MSSPKTRSQPPSLVRRFGSILSFSALTVALALPCGCAERSAQRAFERATEQADEQTIEQQREQFAAITKRWPRTRAAEKARREIEWVNELRHFSERGPALMAWDAVREVAQAAERFRLDHGRFPSDARELVPRYLKGAVEDPWGHSVHYLRVGDGYRVICYGEDGIPGGYGASSDVLIDTGREVKVGKTADP